MGVEFVQSTNVSIRKHSLLSLIARTLPRRQTLSSLGVHCKFFSEEVGGIVGLKHTGQPQGIERRLRMPLIGVKRAQKWARCFEALRQVYCRAYSILNTSSPSAWLSFTSLTLYSAKKAPCGISIRCEKLVGTSTPSNSLNFEFSIPKV